MFAPIVVSFLLAACGTGNKEAQSPAPSRVEGIARPAAKSQASMNGFCDVEATAEGAKPFQVPELEGSFQPTVQGKWTWYSLWATWCVPCLEEMPRMKAWVERMKQEGTEVNLRFISVDATRADVDGFRKTHPDVPAEPRLLQQEGMAPWLAMYGVTQAASIPIHIFVDGQDRVRCIRLGAISDSDYVTVKTLFGQK